MWLTIIIPTYHDDNALQRLLGEIQSWHPVGVAMIVVDGVQRMRPSWLPQEIIYLYCPANRGAQLHLGGQNAQTEKLLFLHADSHFSEGSPLPLLQSTTAQIGFFKIQFDDSGLFFKVLALGSTFRAKREKLIFGDQGLFITKVAYQKVGGYPAIPLMEDFEFSQRLRKRHFVWTAFDWPIVTSARKYREEGCFKTFFRMQKIKLLYKIGTDPEVLKKMYYGGK